MTMLTRTSEIKPATSYLQPDPAAMMRRECSRLIHAAVVSKRFRARLLNDPLQAIETGYGGEQFMFTCEEKARIRAIQADTLEDFAAQLVRIIEVPVAVELAYLSNL